MEYCRGSPKCNGVDLLVTQNRQEHWICLGAHCQCAFLASRATSRDDWRVPVPGFRARLPAWVVNSPKHAITWQADCTPIGTRFHWHDSRLPPPLGVNMKFRFRTRIRVIGRGSVSRCILPSWLPAVAQEIGIALANMQGFLERLLSEKSKLDGAEGANAGFRRVLQACDVCFDWARLLHTTPKVNDLTEFKELVQRVLPYLRNTEWPSRDDFPAVEHAWPRLDALQVQYVLLLSRLRNARYARPSMYRSWWVPKGFVVKPLTVSRLAEWLTRACFQQKLSSFSEIGHRQGKGPALRLALLHKIAAVLTEFLGPLASDGRVPLDAPGAWRGLAPRAPLQVSLQRLAMRGSPRIRSWVYVGGVLPRSGSVHWSAET